jgi:DNA invertase Pin-like site-specific DNA recombinase
MLIGYARVSSRRQETYLQMDAFERGGVRTIYQEKADSTGKRPQLRRALASMKPGDVLVVWKIDRVARSLRDLLEILATLSAAGMAFRSLTEPIDTSTPVGEFLVQILGAVAQLERSMIRERAIAGQVAAIKRGVRWGGRPLVLTDAELEELLIMKASGWFTWYTLADMYGVTPKAIFRSWARRKKRAHGPVLPPILGPYLLKSGQSLQ